MMPTTNALPIMKPRFESGFVYLFIIDFVQLSGNMLSVLSQKTVCVSSIIMLDEMPHTDADLPISIVTTVRDGLSIESGNAIAPSS